MNQAFNLIKLRVFKMMTVALYSTLSRACMTTLQCIMSVELVPGPTHVSRYQTRNPFMGIVPGRNSGRRVVKIPNSFDPLLIKQHSPNAWKPKYDFQIRTLGIAVPKTMTNIVAKHSVCILPFDSRVYMVVHY